MKFKSEYKLTKKHYFEASLWASKFFLTIMILLFTSIAIFCAFRQSWLPCIIPAFPLAYSIFIFFNHFNGVVNGYKEALKKHENNDIDVIVDFSDDIINYTVCDKIYKFEYKDIYRIWKSEKLYIFVFLKDKKKSVISIRKKDVNKKEFFNFIKKKRLKKER